MTKIEYCRQIRNNLIKKNVHVNDDLTNGVGYVNRDYDLEEHESYIQVTK